MTERTSVYERNNARRRAKYHADAEYRERMLARQKEKAAARNATRKRRYRYDDAYRERCKALSNAHRRRKLGGE